MRILSGENVQNGVKTLPYADLYSNQNYNSKLKIDQSATNGNGQIFCFSDILIMRSMFGSEFVPWVYPLLNILYSCSMNVSSSQQYSCSSFNKGFLIFHLLKIVSVFEKEEINSNLSKCFQVRQDEVFELKFKVVKLSTN